MKIKKPKNPIPVSIIGGFLGAGKTTLLNDVLTSDHGIKVGVLVNDFGAINIDSKLVVGVERDDTINLANGCICCNIREDLIGACLLMLNRPEPPEALLIETSGVSDPYQVANTFINPDYHGAFLLNTILTIVDAEQLPKLKGEMAKLATTQIEIADFLVFNKIDLVQGEDLECARNMVRKISPKARIIETTYGIIPMELVFSDMTNDTREFPVSKEHKPAHSHNHNFSTWHWTSDQKLSLPKLKQAMDNLPDTIFRAKGIVYIEEMPVYKVILQMVGGRYDFGETDLWAHEKPVSEIVLIGPKGSIDNELLQSEFDACIGRGDLSQSPILRLVHKFAPQLLDEK